MDGWTGTLLKRRRTKIVATVGPASSDEPTLRALIDAGVSVFRLNMSHGDHDTHRLAFKRIRATAAEQGEPIAVLADLCGPKIRVGQFADGEIVLADGETVTVTTRDVRGHAGLIPSQYNALHSDVRRGSRILLADGLMELRVNEVDGQDVHCTVVHGGVLKDRKGINLPDVDVSAPSLSEKDRDDARFALDLGVDFLALSFVRRAADIDELRAMIPPEQETQIVAKIEKPQALEVIDEILDAADAIMVARGDLGVELPPELVPIVQRELVKKARAKNKPTIVATQMLESMIEHPQPTRAEVSDVSTAVFSGTDAVMLSAETAAGQYPVRAVEMMDRIARQVEGQLWSENAFALHGGGLQGVVPLHVAVARSTAQLSRDLGARSIVAFSASGATAAVMASARPAAPLLALTANPAASRRTNLLWGVVPVLVDERELADAHALARKVAVDLGLASAGQYILALSGLGPAGGDTPGIAILRV